VGLSDFGPLRHTLAECVSDRTLQELAARQYGCVTFAQAHDCGLTRSQLTRRLERGLLEHVGNQVLRVVGAPQTWRQALMAGLLDLGPGVVVSGRAAAALHGFDGWPEGPLDFTIARSARRRTTIWPVHTALRIDRIDTTTIDHLPCTTASRTILDLARTATRAELARAIDSAIHLGASSPAFLRRRLSARRGPGHWGVRLVDDLLADAGGHSALERAFLSLVRQAGLPRPTCQPIFYLDGRRVGRVDFCFEAILLVVEVSGRRGHSSDAERAKDAQRRNELQALGYRVVEFTSADIWHRPAYVVATLRRHGL
jgi:hypothetical protein